MFCCSCLKKKPPKTKTKQTKPKKQNKKPNNNKRMRDTLYPSLMKPVSISEFQIGQSSLQAFITIKR